MRTEQLEKAYMESVILDRGGYKYFVNPMCDGIPHVSKELLEEIAGNAEEMIDADYDYVLTPEAIGIPIATAFTLRTGKPFMVIRKRRYDLPGEICVNKSTGYENSVSVYINFVNPGDRIVILDDVISTGGTLKAICDALKERGAKVVTAIMVLNKNDDLAQLSDELGFPIKTMLNVRVRDGKPVILCD